MNKNSSDTLFDSVIGISDKHIEFAKKYLLNIGMEQWLVTHYIYKKSMKEYKRLYGSRRKLIDAERRHILGIFGEIYVRNNLGTSLNTLGYMRSSITLPLSYWINYQYPVKKKRHKCADHMDIRLTITTDLSDTFTYLFEIKNWGLGRQFKNMSEGLFNRKILNNFLHTDEEHKLTWILVINHRYIPKIKEYSDKHNILILGLREHLTPELYWRLNKNNLIISTKDIIDANLTKDWIDKQFKSSISSRYNYSNPVEVSR